MSKPLTLYVVHTTRPPNVVADIVANVRWASNYPCLVLIVGDKADENRYSTCGADLVYGTDVKNEPIADFRFFDGLRIALHKNMQFEQVICFRDDAVFPNQGLDKWVAEAFYRDPVDLLAVADRNYYSEGFLRVADLFSRWYVPHETFDRTPQPVTAHTAVFCMTAKLVKELFYRRLLVPPGYAEWPLSFGSYVTWACHLLMLSSRMVGTMDKPVPPFYVNDGWGGAYNPPPHLLHPGVLVYWSIRRSAGYGESDLRDWINKRTRAP